jgi:Cu2+-containing amine oxidase
MKNKQILAAAAIATLFSLTSAYAKSMDPVSDSEIDKATSLAMQSLQTPVVARRSVSTTQVATASASISSAETTSTVQFLNVETHRFDKGDSNSDARWTDVSAYDYATDELIINVVNLDTNAVVSSKRYTNMQPPLVKDELDRALSIVMDDEEERSIIDNEFKRITGQTLTSMDQLQYKAFTFFADSMPNVVNTASKSCGANRCAQLMLFTHDNIVFEVSPIVNLSAGVVTQRMGY